MADMHIDGFDAYHYAARTKRSNSIETNTETGRARPPRWERVETK